LSGKNKEITEGCVAVLISDDVQFSFIVKDIYFVFFLFLHQVLCLVLFIIVCLKLGGLVGVLVF